MKLQHCLPILLVFLFSCGRPTTDIQNINLGWRLVPIEIISTQCENNQSKTEDCAPQLEEQKLPLRLSAIPGYQNFHGTVEISRPLPPEIEAAIAANLPITVWTPMVSNVSTMKINGHTIGQIGSREPYKPGLYRYYLKNLPANFLQKENNILSIEMFTPDDYPLHISGADMYIGPADQVYAKYYSNELLQFVLLSVYLAVGLYHLLLFIRRTKDSHNLYFGLFTVLVSIYWFFYTGSRDLVFGDAQLFRTKLEYATVFNLPLLLVLFLQKYFTRKISLSAKILAGFSALNILGAILTPYKYMQFFLKAWQYSLPIVAIYIIVFIVRQALKKNIDALYLILGIFILLGGAITDLLIALNILEIERIGQYTFLIFILGIAGVLANRFMTVQNQVEELNENLEKKVKARTEELSKSLTEIQKLKEYQDGDYFLTSLLLNPLSQNNAKSELVKIHFYSNQKKKFRFRQWSREIGGDINIAQSIKLQNRNCTFFVNSDAMGKSLQGAGGALVTGAIVQTILERTRLSSNEQNYAPERWLKNAFVELQRVFEGFDGSMLISVFMGVIDDITGAVWYINAEHPLTVLYRDGKAAFIENQVVFRKIGTMGLENKLYVQSFQMKTGDVLVMGSDGRDDISIGMLKGERIINEDETLFLNEVEKAKSDLDLIASNIAQRGEITDDFSMIRISYRENEQDAHLSDDEREDLNLMIKEIVKDNLTEFSRMWQGWQLSRLAVESDKLISVLNEQSIVRYQQKKYAEALVLLDAQLALQPTNGEVLYRISRCYARLRRMKEAIEPSERLRLREPDNLKNLVHLSALYYSLGNHERAQYLIGIAETVDEDHPGVRNIREKISNSAAKN
ncbi:MAG: SpoIIE family protein phosphatase [Leptospiraceae bacterium]|nr:SpoIIE family protein phosphatase [Leptospiraceae bacterium]